MHGWVADLALGLAGAATIYATALLIIEEGRARERADRDQRGQ
jgi:hypothetical protein